jgi:hypothetical protein
MLHQIEVFELYFFISPGELPGAGILALQEKSKSIVF